MPRSSNPDSPVPVALALLDQRWPVASALADAGGRVPASAAAPDPRYLIGRLHQALAVLLAEDLPPADATTALLSQALADAISWRYHQCRPCDCREGLCPPCAADWDQADRYHQLALTLGAVGDIPAGNRPPARVPAGT